jgi:hypothetical protein
MEKVGVGPKINISIDAADHKLEKLLVRWKLAEDDSSIVSCFQPSDPGQPFHGPQGAVSQKIEIFLNTGERIWCFFLVP